MAKTKTKTMSENARKVLDYLKNAGVGVAFTYKQVAEDLGFDKPAAVVGTVTSLAKKDYVEKFEDIVETEDGKSVTVKKFALNEAGMSYCPDQAVAE